MKSVPYGGDLPLPDNDDRFPVREMLRAGHQTTSSTAIMGADADGVLRTYWQPAAPVVVDANELRGDILYACRTGQRTVLVNAANTGALRLYCAEHVATEIDEHADDWCANGQVGTEQFLDCWRTNYAPLVRVVTVPDGLLHQDEQARIDTLRDRHDPDDVPSATLALLLEAFYLSKDRRAVEAVYGPQRDFAEHQGRLDVLRAGGDAGQLAEMLHATAALGVGAGQGVVRGVQAAARHAPWLAAPFALAVGYLLATWTPERGRRVGRGLLLAVRAVGEVAIEQHHARERFLAAVPYVPDWPALADTLDPSAVLARSCLHTLSRVAQSHYSADELASDLPALPVAAGATKVREVLRRYDCFTEVYRGRFQLGRPLVTSAIR